MKKTLAKEIKPALQDYTKEIENLRKKAEKRRENLKKWSESQTALRQEIEALEGRAHELIDSGGEPAELLQEASKLRQEESELQRLIQQVGDPEKDLQKQIEEKADILHLSVREAIKKSKFKRDAEQDLLEALRRVVEVYDNFHEAAEGIYKDLSLTPEYHQLLEFKDDSEETKLAHKIGVITNKYAKLFNRRAA